MSVDQRSLRAHFLILGIALLGSPAVHADPTDTATPADPAAVAPAAPSVPAAPTQKTVNQVTGIFSGLKVYPNPWRSNKHADQNITFAPLPADSTVKIFTTSGRWVKTLPPSGNVWDLTNDSGKKVASGVYLYLIKAGSSDETAKGKIIIIK